MIQSYYHTDSRIRHCFLITFDLWYQKWRLFLLANGDVLMQIPSKNGGDTYRSLMILVSFWSSFQRLLNKILYNAHEWLQKMGTVIQVKLFLQKMVIGDVLKISSSYQKKKSSVLYHCRQTSWFKVIQKAVFRFGGLRSLASAGAILHRSVSTFCFHSTVQIHIQVDAKVAPVSYFCYRCSKRKQKIPRLFGRFLDWALRGVIVNRI